MSLDYIIGFTIILVGFWLIKRETKKNLIKVSNGKLEELVLFCKLIAYLSIISIGLFMILPSVFIFITELTG